MGAQHLLMLFAGIWAVEKKKHVAVEEGGGAIHLVSTSIVLNTCCISYAVMGARVFHAHVEGEKSAVHIMCRLPLKNILPVLGYLAMVPLAVSAQKKHFGKNIDSNHKL